MTAETHELWDDGERIRCSCGWASIAGVGRSNDRHRTMTIKEETVKKSKASVDYSPGHQNSRCGLCRYFVRLNWRVGSECELVEGKIDPRYWCRLFKLKTPQTRGN